METMVMCDVMRKDLIQIEERIPIDQCIHHPWLQDNQVFSDLRSLEDRLGCGRYLTEAN